jgi:integrase
LIADVTDFVALTGARRSEVCRLRAADVDVENRTLTITEKKRRHGHTTYRTLPVHDDLLPVLRRRLASGKPIVFTASIDTLAQGLAKAVAGTRFDLKGFGFHALRHSAASRLLAANVPVTAVADVLGHADARTTLGIYAHAFDADSRRAVALL